MRTQSIKYLEGGGAEVIEVDVPDPGPGQVQVRSAACGICAWDIATFRTGAQVPWSAPPGHEGAGYVEKLGPDVSGIEVGDRVTGGSFAGLRNHPTHQLYPLPRDGFEDEHLIIEPVSCVVNALDRAELRPGYRLAIIGCGFMGLMFAQALSRFYADQVVAIDINAKRLEMAAGFGIEETLNAGDEGFDECVPELKARGIDVVFDCTGAQAGIDLASRIVREGGQLSLFGWNHGRPSFPGTDWHLGGFTVINSAPGAKIRDAFPAAIRMLERCFIDLKPLVTHVVPVTGYPSLLDRVVKGEEPDYIKGVVKPN
jgi:threonine dehydrogenase-like Zn-dependent dehydrogenase